jgi:hypothetical protein
VLCCSATLVCCSATFRCSFRNSLSSIAAYVDSAIAGLEGAKNLSGGNVRRLIQIRSTTSSLENLARLASGFAATPRSRIQVPQTPSKARRIRRCNAYRLCERQRSTATRVGRDGAVMAQGPPGSTEIVSDGLPVFHWRHDARIS